MIHFDRISIQNFASIGNKPLKIDYNDFKIGLVSGSNGAGKSQTFLYSLYYALYGKSFSKTTLGSLINNINKKGLLVDLEFHINSTNYRIVRGMKPNVFEIYINGNLKPQLAATKDYQDYLTKNILKMDERTFRQLVVVGSTTYTPFMRLSAGERRVVVEDMLNLSVFSKMLECSKSEFNTTFEEKRSIESKISDLNHKKDVLEAKKKERASVTSDLIKSIKLEIAGYQEKIKLDEDEKSKIQISKSEFEAIKESIEKIKTTIAEAKRLRVKKVTTIDHVTKRQNFFKEHDSCPTCEQEISTDLKMKIEASTEEVINKHNEELDIFDQKLKSLEQKLESKSVLYDEFVEKISKIQSLDSEIRSYKKSMERAMRELSEMQETLGKSDSEDDQIIEKLEKDIQLQKEQLDRVSEKQNAIQQLQTLLKDDGVKADLIQQYVPMLNQYIQKYLEIMGYGVRFTFDQNFEAKLSDGHTEDAEYASRSEGEQLRLNLAVLFALRSLVGLRSSISTNILILDEFTNGVIDTDGFIAVNSILASLQHTNIIVISHDWEQFTELADKNYLLEKINGFTKIRQVG